MRRCSFDRARARYARVSWRPRTALQEEKLSSFHLRLNVLREQICGSHVLARGPPRVAALNIRFRELVPGFAKARILRQRVSVLNDGLSDLLLAQQLITARQILPLGDFRIAGTGNTRGDDKRDSQNPGVALDPSMRPSPPGDRPSPAVTPKKKTPSASHRRGFRKDLDRLKQSDRQEDRYTFRLRRRRIAV